MIADKAYPELGDDAVNKKNHAKAFKLHLFIQDQRESLVGLSILGERTGGGEGRE